MTAAIAFSAASWYSELVRGGHVERGADVVEAGRRVVLRQHVLQLTRAAEQIAHGVLVLGAVEPADEDPALLLLAFQRSRVQFLLEPIVAA